MQVIEIKNLSKRYAIGNRSSHTTLRDSFRDRFNFFRKEKKGNQKYHYALRDINIDIQQGDVVGIIGANGVGKSTLLKIISKITYPDSGYVQIRGKVASLLEVGTGFNAELSGRDNIFLSGSILGMKKREIEDRYNDIVAFAEIGDYIDVPVKKYSSGMQVRLAFAVAAHLDPQILLVDEVLAVGDIKFQRKCLDKMNDLARPGERTILFVSHDLNAVERICTKCILLKDGKVDMYGNTAQVIKKYIDDNVKIVDSFLGDRKDREGSGEVRILDLEIENASDIRIRGALKVKIKYAAHKQYSGKLAFGLSIWTKNDTRLISLSTDICDPSGCVYPLNGSIICDIPSIPLVDGEYFINPSVFAGAQLLDYVPHAKLFEIKPSDVYRTGKTPNPDWGLVIAPCHWKIVDA